MFVKRLRAILIDRALYKYCIIIIIIITFRLRQSRRHPANERTAKRRTASGISGHSHVHVAIHSKLVAENRNPA